MNNVYFNYNILVIVVLLKIRVLFRKLVEIVYFNLIVLLLNEIFNDIKIKVEGVVSIYDDEKVYS